MAIVGIVLWFKARDKELQYHQDLRIREMEHQLKMKELEMELEKTKARSSPGQSCKLNDDAARSGKVMPMRFGTQEANGGMRWQNS